MKIIIPLGICCLAHWAILWRGMFIVHAVYDDTLQSCVVTTTNHVFLNISFFASKSNNFSTSIIIHSKLCSSHGI